jgi:hypothetical protein
MRKSKRIAKALVVLAAAVAVIVVVVKLRAERAAASEAVKDIESEFDALDPIARVSAVAQLSRDAIKDVKARRS